MASAGNNKNQVIDGIVKRASKQDALYESENRDMDRYPYHGHIVLILLDYSGNPSPPLLLRAADISTGGIGVVSRHMFHTGSIGAVQMLRSDGKAEIIGVKVKHCRYAGDMKHHSGFEFAPVPERIKESYFMSSNGSEYLVHAMMAAARVA